MFTALSERLTAVLKRVTGRGVLSEQDVTDALREIRRHLLEADVSFEVTQGFVERVRERAVGAIAVHKVSPGQQVVKLVRDEIARMLGASDDDLAGRVESRRAVPLQFASVGPTVILLVGLQGSGKTTTAAKLARRLKLEQKAPGLVAADPYRPAALDQLRQLGEQVGVAVFGMRDAGSGRGVIDSRRDRRADQVRRGRGKAGSVGAVRSAARCGADPGPGRRGSAGRESSRHHGRRRRATARAKGPLEARHGPGGLPRRAEADAGDGTAQAGPGVAAGCERAGAETGRRRRQAAEACRGDRAGDDPGRARRSVDPDGVATAADREGRGTPGAGNQSAAGAIPAHAEVLEKDVNPLWQLVFGCGAKGAKGRAISASSWRTPARPATDASSRCSATTTRVPTRPTSRWTRSRRASGSTKGRSRPIRCDRS